MARRDLVLLLLLVATVIALAALVGGADRGAGDARDPRPSSHLAGEGGTLALYWTLRGADLPVARRGEPLLYGSEPRGSMALLAPTTDLSPAEVSVVMEHVRAGGLLVFAASPWSGRGLPLHDSLGLRLVPARGRSVYAAGEGVSAEPETHPWTADAAAVPGFRTVFADSSPALEEGGARTLLRGEAGAAAVVFAVGEGRVLALADHQPLSNARLREGGAALLVARAAAQAGDTLWFHEFHHGFRDGAAAGSTLRRIGAMIPAGAWIQLALLAVLALYAAGRRFGAPVPPAPAQRRSPLEHVEALAGAYRQADARQTARRLLLAGLARRLGRRAPPDERAAAAMLDRLARGSPAAAEPAAELQRAWKKGTAGDLAVLARHIDHTLEEIRR